MPRSRIRRRSSAHTTAVSPASMRSQVRKVGGDAQVGAAEVALAHRQRPVADLDGDGALLVAGEAEVVHGGEPVGTAALKGDRQPADEGGDRCGRQAVAHPPGALAREAAGDVGLGVGAGDDVHGLAAVLQRPHHLVEVALAAR